MSLRLKHLLLATCAAIFAAGPSARAEDTAGRASARETSPAARETAPAAQPAPSDDAPPREQRRPVRQDPGSLFTGPGRMEPVPDELKNVAIDEHLNSKLPLDLTFTDDWGNRVQLQKYFTGRKPVILQLGYYGCPMLCDLVSQGTVSSLRNVDLEPGKDYEIVFLSIDPAESREMAAKKKQNYLRAYGRGTGDGWHFLTGQKEPIKQLTQAAGFNYKWVASAQQFSHPAAIILCTPEGKVSRYLYGVQFKSDTLRLSLVEASEGKIGTTVDHFLLTCFQYDGKQGKYAASAMGMMRIGGVLTVIIVAFVLYRLFRREARMRAQGLGPYSLANEAALRGASDVIVK